MAKGPRKLGMRREKNQGGCIWSLVSKLHSHGDGGSTQKLLLDQNRCTEAALAGRGNSRTNPDFLMTMRDANDGERAESMVIGGKPSVKTLMEEEMIVEADLEWIKSLKRGKQSFDRVTDNEQSSVDDVRDIVEYLGGLFQQRSGIWEEQDEREEEEKFSRALGKALSRQLVNGNQLSEEEMVHRSKVLVNMLRILNSAEFSLLELMRDPEAMMMKCTEILQSSSKRSSVRSVLSVEDERDLFKTSVGSSLVASRIVILKPWMTDPPKPAKSFNPGIDAKGREKKSCGPTFLSDIKRKLKNIVTKESAEGRSGRDLYTGKVAKPGESGIWRDYKHEPARDEGTSSMGMILLRPELNCSIRTSPGRRWRKPEFAQVAETDMCAFRFLGEGLRAKESSRDGNEHDVIEKGEEDMGIAVDPPERPSPVSVLEPIFSDDDVSPAQNFRSSVEFPRRHREIEFEEDDDIWIDEADAYERTFEDDAGLDLGRVADLLRASDLRLEDLYLKSQSSDQLLEASLVRDWHLGNYDAKLLVDCANEVLFEACGSFVGRSCLSLSGKMIKPVLSMDFTVHEVCRGVKWVLDPIPPPHSLEQIIWKDLSRSGSWLDITLEGESIGFEVGDAIFSELLEEIVSSDRR